MKNANRIWNEILTVEDREALTALIKQICNNYPDADWIDVYTEVKTITETEMLQLALIDKLSENN